MIQTWVLKGAQRGLLDSKRPTKRWKQSHNILIIYTRTSRNRQPRIADILKKLGKLHKKCKFHQAQDLFWTQKNEVDFLTF